MTVRGEGRRSLPLVAALLMLGLLAATPVAGAATLRVTDPLPFAGTVQVAGSAQDLDQGPFLVSGRLDYASSVHGIVLLFGAEAPSRIEAQRVRVFDPADPVAYHFDQPTLDLANATIVPDPGGSLFWSVRNGTATAALPYTFGFLFALERSLPDLGPFASQRNGTVPPALVADARDQPWHVNTPNERSLLTPAEGGFLVHAGEQVRVFPPGDWIVEVYGANATLQGTGVAVPLEPDAEARFAQAGPAAFSDGFSINALGRFLDGANALADGFSVPEFPAPPECAQECTDSGSVAATASANGTDDATPADPAPALSEALQAHAATIERLGGLLNGALFGEMTAQLAFGDSPERESGFTLLRFTSMQVRHADGDSVQVQGASPLAYTGGSVVHDERVLRLGPFVLTTLAIGLYVVALGAWVVARVVPNRPNDAARDARVRPYATVAAIVGAVAAFVQLDREIHFVVGSSVIGSFGAWGTPAGGAAALATTSLVGLLVMELVVAAALTVLYALPLVVLGAALLRLGGLGRPTYGLAIGVAALAAWALGAPLVRPFLDAAFGSFLGA